MKPLTINQKINIKSFQSKSRERINYIKSKYKRTIECIEAYGDWGGGIWEVPNHQIWEQQLIHLTPRICPD